MYHQVQHRKNWRWVIGCLLLFLAGCQPIQPPALATPTIPEVLIEVNDSAFTIPADFPGGIVRVTVKNTGSKDLDVGFSRLRAGSSVAEFKELAKDVMGNLAAIAQKVSFMPSFSPLRAGESQQVIIDFKTGEFVLDAAEHVEGDLVAGAPRIYGVFTADKIVGTVEPKTDVKVEMNDFSYVMPDEIKAGKQMWQYDNAGKQWHAQFFLKPNPGVTVEEILKALQAEGKPAGPPPFEFVPTGGIQPISEGERAWVEFTLEPGTYLAGCPIPDLAAMMAGEQPMSHLQHGMYRLLTVK